MLDDLTARPTTKTYARDNSAALNRCRKHNGGIITHDKNQMHSASQSPHAINSTRRHDVDVLPLLDVMPKHVIVDRDKSRRIRHFDNSASFC